MIAVARLSPGHVHRQDPRWGRASPEEFCGSAEYAGTEHETVAWRIEEPSQDGDRVFEVRYAAGDRTVVERDEHAPTVITEDSPQTDCLARLARRRCGIEFGHAGQSGTCRS
jgi:hypothetical protein